MKILFAIICILFVIPTFAQENRLIETDEFSLSARFPPYYLATGTAILFLDDPLLKQPNRQDKEAISEWLSNKGLSVFVMQKEAPSFEDLSKVIEYLRGNHSLHEIDPQKIVVIDFGHSLDQVLIPAKAMPHANFAISFNGSITSSAETQSLPLFLAITDNQALNNLITHKLPNSTELHVYHGQIRSYKQAIDNLPSNSILDRLEEWLRGNQLMIKRNPSKYEKLYGEDAVAYGVKQRPERLLNDFAELKIYDQANKQLSQPKPHEKRVVFLGNSITVGWYRHDSAFFKSNNFVARGISSQTSAQLLLRFRQDVVNLNPKAVVIHIGINDIAENTGPYDIENTMANILSMIDIAQANHIKVLLASVVPSTKFQWKRKLGDRSNMIIELNSQISALCSKESIPFIDYHSAMKNEKNGMDIDLANDGVHPTPKGYELMKQILMPVLNNVLNQP